MVESDLSFLNRRVLHSEKNLSSPDNDSVVVVVYPHHFHNQKFPKEIENTARSALGLDKGLEQVVGVVNCPNVSGGRLILSPTGPITPYDDVRSIYEAAKNGIERALKAGSRSPVLVVETIKQFPESELVAILGALNALYVPIQVRELVPEKQHKVKRLGIYGHSVGKDINTLIKVAESLEIGRTVARDIGGGDPERMTPANVVAYVLKAFATDSNVSINVIDDIKIIEKEYPLFAAVNRAASEIPRHRGRIIFLEYNPDGDKSSVSDTILLVGKGVTYDTGGADIKHGGNMAGMSRDKCGAAAVAGFLKVCALLRPRHIKVIGAMSMVRNSVGENSYVADELVVARNGARVRVGNTDAEGRMIMADLLTEMKERAAHEKNPHLYTIATLTGHAARAMGSGYSIVMDNHMARSEKHAQKLQQSGDSVADLFEVSSIRRDDLKAHRGQCEGDDVHQANNLPSTLTNRGHQNPAGFLLLASGLHVADVKYSHLDIAASGGCIPDEPTGAPILALADLYKLIKY